MKVTETAVRALSELSDMISVVDEEAVGELTQAILKAGKIYVTGAGRSLLMLRGFAMRLMHLGLQSYIVGDTNTPAFEPGDLLIVGSGSGETAFAAIVAQKAKKLGGTVALFTIREKSTVAKLSDIVIRIPAYTDKAEEAGMKKSILPGATTFEHAMLVLGDTMILPLAQEVGTPTDSAFVRHANLE